MIDLCIRIESYLYPLHVIVMMKHKNMFAFTLISWHWECAGSWNYFLLKNRNPPIFSISWLLTHWGRETHVCVGNLTIIGSDNGLSPARRQAIIWTNAGLLLIGPLGTNFSENLIKINTFPFKKMHLKMSSGKWWPFCLGLNVLMTWRHKEPGNGYSWYWPSNI